MQIKNLIFRNASYQFAAQIINTIIGFALNVLLSRSLGVEGFGQYAYVFAFYYFFLAVLEMGIGPVVIREIAKNPEQGNKIMGSMMLFKFILALLGLSAAWTLIHFMKISSDLRASLMIYSLILPLIALELPSEIFSAVMKFEYPALIGMLKSTANLIFAIFCVLFRAPLPVFFGFIIFSEIMVLGLILKLSREFVHPNFSFDVALCKRILQSGIPIGLSGILIAIIERADFIMLQQMAKISDIGFYAAAYRIKTLFEVFPPLLLATLFPLMSKLIKEDRIRLRRVYLKSLLIFAGAATILFLFTFFFSKPLIFLIYGAAYERAATGLVFLIGSTVGTFLGITAGNLLISGGWEKVNLFFLTGAAILNICLNFLFIPKYGFLGAAAATSVAYLLNAAGLLMAAEIFFLKQRKNLT